MKLDHRTVLITGGSSGIGLALAERLVRSNNRVIVTGRRPELLAEAAKQVPGLITEVSDAGDPEARVRLAASLTERYPELDVVINNAGIQRRVDFVVGEAWAETQRELAINLEGPVHLSALFVPHLLKRPLATLINVSSGLAFAPIAGMPIYCATKAALHSFTLSLRHQLRDTSVEVIEIIPPAVYSNLGGSHQFGVPTDEYADSVMAQLAEGRSEITYQFSTEAAQGSRATHDAIFARMNR